MLPEADEVEPHLIGQHALLDHMAQDLCLWEWLAAGVEGHIAEGVYTELDRKGHISLF